MRVSFFLSLFFLFTSCVQKNELNVDFYDEVLDLIIENSHGEIVEFPEIYNVQTSKIANDEDENLQLVTKLKAKGFRVIHWGRGNHSLGPRIIVVHIKKNDCECEVAKVYYTTAQDSLYHISEKISCKKVK